MKKYTTKPIDFTGCHPVIAEALKRGEAIKCWVWDIGSKKQNDQQRWIVGYTRGVGYTTENFVEWDHAEPTPIKTRRIMPPELAIPVLIAEGWKFNASGQMVGPSRTIVPKMLSCLGRPLDDPDTISWSWPSCIIEEVEDDK